MTAHQLTDTTSRLRKSEHERRKHKRKKNLKQYLHIATHEFPNIIY